MAASLRTGMMTESSGSATLLLMRGGQGRGIFFCNHSRRKILLTIFSSHYRPIHVLRFRNTLHAIWLRKRITDSKMKQIMLVAGALPRTLNTVNLLQLRNKKTRQGQSQKIAHIHGHRHTQCISRMLEKSFVPYPRSTT